MKIINLSKFIRFILIIVGLSIAFMFILNSKSLSKTEIRYMDYTISENDTLWQIANLVKENNLYYSKYDVREIIYELKKINNKNNSSIVVNEVIKIPEI